ncbi:MAG TPA: hypothetical protein VK404_12160, partial [Spirosoma sp.]|nr:hypothetical protein [Spirosoma sp.]
MPNLFLLSSVILLPFAGFLALTQANRHVAGGLAVGLTGIGLLLSILLAINLPVDPVTFRTDWATFSNVSFGVSFRLDALTVLMLVLVHFVALLVQIYSIAYLHEEPEPHQPTSDNRQHARYFSYLQLFIG